MAISKLEIANRALDAVGAVPLTSLDQAADTARTINRNYDITLERCLRKFIWPFAVKRVALAQNAEAPTNEFSYRYNLPVDYLRMEQVYPRGAEYRIEGGYLVTDETAITISYVSNESVDNPSKMDPGFIDYFTLELAHSIAVSLTDSVDIANRLHKLADIRFKEASAISSQEFPEVIRYEGPWIEAFEHGWGAY